MTTDTVPYLVGMPTLSRLNDNSDRIETIRLFMRHLMKDEGMKVSGLVEDSPSPETLIHTLDNDLIKELIYEFLVIDPDQLADEMKRFEAMLVQVNSVTDVVKNLVKS